MALICRPSISADDVIDLTGPDDIEISSMSPVLRSTLPGRPMPVRPNHVVDIPQSNHGLLLGEAFGQQVAGYKRGTTKTSDSPSKRQRVEKRKPESKPNVPPPSAGLGFLMDEHRALPRGDNLKDILRFQVFPHINKCLDPYGQLLQKGARKRIGKKVAAALCEGSFVDHVQQHDGRLTADFEKEVEARCKILTDNLAGRALRKSRGRHSKAPRQLANGGNPQSEEDQQLVILVDSSEDETAAPVEPPVGQPVSGILPAQPGKSYTSLQTKSFRVEELNVRSTKCNHNSNTSPVISRQRSATILPVNGALTSSCRDPPGSSLRQTGQKLRQQRNKKIKSRRSRRLNPYHTAAFTSALLDAQRLRILGCDNDFHRPFVSAQSRSDIRRGLGLCTTGLLNRLCKEELVSVLGRIIHVDFTQDEVRHLGTLVESALGSRPAKSSIDPNAHLLSLTTERRDDIPRIVSLLKGKYPLPGRTKPDIIAFLLELLSGTSLKQQPNMMHLRLRSCHPNKARGAAHSISSVLRCRELGERRYCTASCETSSVKNILASKVEDTLTRVAEWTDCSGDTCTMAWIPGERFVCGAITHSDSHNQQYNKPGNLMVGSVSNKILTSIPGHRIPRPIISTGENSLAAMRETQDPWLYCTVTSAAYDRFSQKCFTSSYDRTVKVWQIGSDGGSMDLCGVWEHLGVVNFVITSPRYARIATASDYCQDAIRVYQLDENNISESTYCTFSGERANEQFLEPGVNLKTWAYYPATLQWGKAASVAHLLLAGYSPRSYDANAVDIPEDKLNTGELCLWNTNDGSSICVASARTANVFEVMWHPTQPIFFASTSATGEFGDGVMTQIRLFGQTNLGTFSHFKTLDCPGSDINEITCMPNSTFHCYVTASCTDGNTYVWDTSQDDNPVHILSHSVSIENQGYDSNFEDNGVKFAAWGRNVNRFYTGSSDGVVKAWDIRAARGEEFVQDVITLSGGISQGLFSPDCSKLLLGDTTGKVHLLGAESLLEPGEIRTPVARHPIKPHSEPPPPILDENNVEIGLELTARDIAQAYIDQGQIRIVKDEYIGAVKGIEYASTGLFCPPEQQNPDWKKDFAERLHRKKINFSRLPVLESSSNVQHEKNSIKDLKIDSLTHNLLESEGWDFNFEFDSGFDLEPEKNKTEFYSNCCSFLEELEIEEFQSLQKKISQELKIQNRLQNFKARLLETDLK